MAKPQSVPLDELVLDPRLQPREDIDSELVREYAEALHDGAVFPAVVAFDDGAQLLLADGWHRWHGHKLARLAAIQVEVRKGDFDAAMRFSLQANATHGCRRSLETLKRCYDRGVKHEVFADWNVNAVREAIKVSKRWANEITKPARERQERTIRSMALYLKRRFEWTQERIAKALTEQGYEVDQSTVSRWLMQIGGAAEMHTVEPDPTYPTDEQVEAVGQVITDMLEPEVRKELAAEHQKRIDDLREELTKLWNAEKAKLEQKLAEAQDRIEAAKVQKQLDAMGETAEEALADGLEDTVKTEAELDREHDRRMAYATHGPEAMAWGAVSTAINTSILPLALDGLKRLRHPFFERAAIADITVAIAHLRAIRDIAEGRENDAGAQWPAPPSEAVHGERVRRRQGRNGVEGEGIKSVDRVPLPPVPRDDHPKARNRNRPERGRPRKSMEAAS